MDNAPSFFSATMVAFITGLGGFAVAYVLASIAEKRAEYRAKTVELMRQEKRAEYQHDLREPPKERTLETMQELMTKPELQELTNRAGIAPAAAGQKIMPPVQEKSSSISKG